MRRTTAMLTVCFCAAAGCRGGVAQEAYEGAVATARAPAELAPIPEPKGPKGEPIASEIDVPWTVALLSSAKTSAVKKNRKVIVVAAEPGAPGAIVQDRDIYLAADPDVAADKLPTAKTCSGVVSRRS